MNLGIKREMLGDIFIPEKKEKIIQVSSPRIDAVAAKVFNLSHVMISCVRNLIFKG